MNELEQELQETYRKFDAAHKAGDTANAKAFKDYATQLEQELDAGSATSESEKSGPVMNSVKGVADSGLGVVQGLANLVDRGGQALENTFGGKDYGVFHNEQDGVHFRRTPNDNPENTTIREGGEAIEQVRGDIGYTPTTTVDDVKDNLWNVVPFAAERAITSLPYLASPAASAASVLGSTVEQRMDNDRRNSANLTDFATAAVPAAADLALNRYLRTGGSGVVDASKRILNGTVYGAGQNVVQDAATKIGTEVAPTWDSATDAAIEGAGFALGVGVGRQAARLAKAGVDRVPGLSLADASEMPGMKPFLNRIVKERDASNLNLKDITPTSEKGAKIAVDNVHTQLRNEISEEAKLLKGRLNGSDGAELQARIDKATFNAITQKARNKVKNTVSPEDAKWLTGKFGDDAQRLIGLIEETNALATFSRGGYRGGISGLAEKVGINQSTTGFADITALATGGVPGMFTVGRLAANGVDMMTGRRSRLDRAVKKLESLPEDQRKVETPKPLAACRT